MNKEALRLVKKLGLERHPEGGYFRQTYTSDAMVNAEGFDGPRNISTAIYYMLAAGQFSAFHRIRSDEIWHHYTGGSITLRAIDKDGKMSRTRIGKSRPPLAVMKAGTWLAAAPNGKKSYCLVGCTMSPGLATATGSLAKGTSWLRGTNSTGRSLRDTQNRRRFQTSAIG